jgi:hypothetical protein
LVQTTGWQPHVDLRQSLQDLLDDWRKEVRTHGAKDAPVLP